MAKTIKLSLPHQLSQEEARQRLQKGIADLRNQFGGKATVFNENWNGNTLDFNVTAMNHQVSGRVDVLPQEVQLEVNLPWMLALMAETLRGRVEAEGRKMLENKNAKT